MLTEVTRDLVQSWIPTRRREAHKGDFGRVYILAGSVGFSGAPVFAANAAVRSGAGLVFLGVSQAIWPVVAVNCREAMPSPVAEEANPALLETMDACDAVLIGPGLGRKVSTDLRTLRLTEALRPPLILDADGINAVAQHIDSLKMRKGRLTVLTPHEGELMRLRGGIPLTEPRAEVALNFAQQSGCVLVLKGHRTVTAFPDGSVFENTSGNPGMAKGGSGDVLSGMILSLLGQGLPPKQAIPAAVWLHGHAGDLCAAEKGEYGMTPTDLSEKIPEAMKF